MASATDRTAKAIRNGNRPNHSDRSFVNPRGYCFVSAAAALDLPPPSRPIMRRPSGQLLRALELCEHRAGARIRMPPFRYALYLTPPPDSDLWRFGRDVIGRDAATGLSCEGYDVEAWRSLTSEPRRYGFHATVKAPFRLRADLDFVDLTDRVTAFARSFKPFDAGELHVGAMAAADGRAFVVLRPEGRSKALQSFEACAVRTLDALRAPLAEDERTRRNVSKLTPRQRYYLEAWGYPYVIDEFRPHITLTNAVADPAPLIKSLQWEFSLRVASRTMRVDAVTLFGEASPNGDFRILRHFPLGRPNRGRRVSSRVAAAAFID